MVYLWYIKSVERIKNVEKYWNIKNIYIYSNYWWYKYSKKVKNNENSRNMHIFTEDYSMERCIMHMFHSREKYDPLKSWTSLNHTLNSFFYHFLTNCIYDFRSNHFIYFVSSSFKLKFIQIFVVINFKVSLTNFEQINLQKKN